MFEFTLLQGLPCLQQHPKFITIQCGKRMHKQDVATLVFSQIKEKIN